MTEKLDWFPLYVRDLLSSARVQMMRPEERGWYVLLLCFQWDSGPLPLDMDDLGALLSLDSDRMAIAWRRIGKAFTESPEGYINERLEEVREEQLAKLKQRKLAGKKGAKARWPQGGNGDRMATASDRDSIKKESKNRKETSPPTPTTARARGEKKETKQERIDREFEEEFWTRYPPRKGNRGKKEALSAWRARIRDGHEPTAIVEAAKRYHRYCEVDEKLATPYVMKASTFLNDPDNFANPWTPPTADEKPRPPRPEPPSPDSEAARVRDELPRQDGYRSGPLTLVGKDTTPDSEKRKRIDEWKRKNSEELDALRSDAIDEMGLALQAVARKPEVARGMVEARVDKLIWERIGEAA